MFVSVQSASLRSGLGLRLLLSCMPILHCLELCEPSGGERLTFGAVQLTHFLCTSDSKLGAAEVWTSRQALQDLYQKMLVTDLEYALDKKVEQDL